AMKNVTSLRLPFVYACTEGDMRIRFLSGLTSGLAGLILSATLLPAQQGEAPPPPPQGGEQRGTMRPQRGDRAGGTITSVGVDRIEVKRMNGEAQTILVGDETRITEGRGEDQKKLGLEDLKSGDMVMATGQPNDKKEFVASAVRRITPEEMARFQSGDRAFGQIVSIDGNEIKVHSQYRGDMTVVVNDQTSFTKDEQSITLKDLKVGDRIFASGKETDGKLVADRVATGRLQRSRGRMTRPPGSDQQPPQQQ
ncbi:MAG TPA: DUF5666 domain-containing protein, partial [Terriglobia bacterium]|nr:DUF5666 domain-containing protein [Terriglobia bacterium]